MHLTALKQYIIEMQTLGAKYSDKSSTTDTELKSKVQVLNRQKKNIKIKTNVCVCCS